MFLRTFCLGLAIVFLGLPALSNSASADDMDWTLRSKFEYRVQFKLYSQARNHVWPSEEDAWGLDDYAAHTVRITCIAGEKICYGAWPTGGGGVHWGVGHDNAYTCTSCCAVCGEGDFDATLGP